MKLVLIKNGRLLVLFASMLFTSHFIAQNLVYGKSYKLDNNLLKEGLYLDINGKGCQDNDYCVSITNNDDRKNSKTTDWIILSASGKKEGQPVLNGDMIILKNHILSPTYLGTRGYSKNFGCTGNLCVSTYANIDNYGSTTWQIKGDTKIGGTVQLIGQWNNASAGYLDLNGYRKGGGYNVSTSINNRRLEASSKWKFKTTDENLENQLINTNYDNVNNNIRYSWVENLNIREKPLASSKVIELAQTTEQLILTGKKSNTSKPIVLRGVLYEDFWYEVSTKKGNKGWVFGGAIKKEDEKKGNDPITDLKFNFENFGEFDLSNWNIIKNDESSGGDSESTTIVYAKPPNKDIDGPSLAITISNVGEYGYSITHELRGQNGKPIKTRTFNFYNDIREISEEIITHNQTPKKIAKRVQKVNVSTFQVKGKPIIAIGDWIYEDLK